MALVQSKMHHAGVTCGDCHAPHSARLLREGNDVSTACHSPGGSSRFPAYSPKYMIRLSTIFMRLMQQRVRSSGFGVRVGLCGSYDRAFIWALMIDEITVFVYRVQISPVRWGA